MALISCRKIGDFSYISADVSKFCFTHDYYKYSFFFLLPLLLIWIFIIPCILMLMLLRLKKNNSLDNPSNIEKLGFLYNEVILISNILSLNYLLNQFTLL